VTGMQGRTSQASGEIRGNHVPIDTNRHGFGSEWPQILAECREICRTLHPHGLPTSEAVTAWTGWIMEL
jgi:hypothetical protein